VNHISAILAQTCVVDLKLLVENLVANGSLVRITCEECGFTRSEFEQQYAQLVVVAALVVFLRLQHLGGELEQTAALGGFLVESLLRFELVNLARTV